MLLSISIDSPIRQSFNEYLGTKVTSLMTSETLHRFAVIDCDVFSVVSSAFMYEQDNLSPEHDKHDKFVHEIYF